MTTQPGKMRHLVSLQREVVTRSDSGAVSREWRTVARFWAFVRPLTAREILSAQHIEGQITHEVRARWMQSVVVRAIDRLLFRDRVLHIVPPINENERDGEMVLLAREAA